MGFSFLAPQFLWALLALPLILALHFLRTRQKQRLVSALFLWRQARDEAQLRRRFSPTWLLLLQLLFAALVVLAVSRPLLTVAGPPARVIIIDASASMAARDDDGVRLDKGRRAARQLIDGAGAVTLVRAGLEANVVAGPTSERQEVLRALGELQAGDREADLQRAVDLALELADGSEVHLVGDQELPGAAVAFHAVAGRAVNYGISAFEPGIGQVYAAVTSNDQRPQELTLTLHQGDRELARSSLLLPANGQATATFPLSEVGGFLEARLAVPPHDALSLDDVAHGGSPRVRVAVEDPAEPLIKALASLPAVDIRQTAEPTAVPADLRILSGPLPAELPPGYYLLFPERSPDPVFTEIRDWNRSDELLRFVDLRETIVGIPSDRASEEGGEGWEPLARAPDLTPLIERLRSDEHTLIRFAFHPQQTDMTLRPAFPVLVANLVQASGQRQPLPLGSLLPPGSTFSGRNVERALVPGIYSTPAGELAAGLLSATETRLPGPTAAAGESALPGRKSGGATRGHLLELTLVAVALAFLLVEWLAWTRGGRPWLRGS